MSPADEAYNALVEKLRNGMTAVCNVDASIVHGELSRLVLPASPVRGGLPALASWLRTCSARLAGVPPSRTSVYEALAVGLCGDALGSPDATLPIPCCLNEPE